VPVNSTPGGAPRRSGEIETLDQRLREGEARRETGQPLFTLGHFPRLTFAQK
jgi:hypothetical protein